MRESGLTVHPDRLANDPLPRLVGQVFHVTSLPSYIRIWQDGLIRHNADGRFPFASPSSEHSWGRKQGYVCLFDLRALPDGELDWVLRKYYFLNPSGAYDHPVFLIIDSEAYDRLIDWTVAPEYTMVVPHAECWYSGDMPTALVREVLMVTIDSGAEA